MPEVVERAEHHVVVEDADGDRRFVLLRCPAPGCDQRLVGSKFVDGEVPGRGTPKQPSEHLLHGHGPECFGLGELAESDYQARLTALGGGTA